MASLHHLSRLETEFEVLRERARKLGSSGDELVDHCSGLLLDILEARSAGLGAIEMGQFIGHLVSKKFACYDIFQELTVTKGLPSEPPPPPGSVAIVLPVLDSKPLPPFPESMKTRPLPGVPKAPLAKQVIPGIMAGGESTRLRCESCCEEFASNYKRQRRCKRCINTPPTKEPRPVAIISRCSSCVWRRPCSYGCTPGSPCGHAWMGWNCGKECHRKCMPLSHGHFYEKG